MNLDKTKILKAVVVIALLCVGVGVLTQVSKQNSLTLQDYAEKYPEATASRNEDDNSKNEDSDCEDSNIKSTIASDGGTDAQNSTASASSSDSAENAKNEPASTFTSVLTGAQLNGDAVLELRTTYTDYFYYEPLSENLRNYITGVSYPKVIEDMPSEEAPTQLSESVNNENNNTESSSSVPASSTTSTYENDTEENQLKFNTVAAADELEISYDELRYLHIMHYNFDGELVEGELICNKGIAQDLVEIFYELYRNEYRIEKMLLIDEYNGDDTASMEDNNTSCFNYRPVPNSNSLSKHALGLALDINPLYNPYITYNEDGSENVSPAAGVDYADRSVSFPYKIDENDLCYKLFTEHGFTWGGNWNSCKDYQHFQKVLP